MGSTLNQLDQIKAKYVLIGEGCFDPGMPLHSSDGTAEALGAYASSRENVRIVPIVRRSKWQHLVQVFKKLPHHNSLYLVARIRLAYRVLRTNRYRLNQAATFNEMLQLAVSLGCTWVMTYDADEYLDNEAISSLQQTSPQPPVMWLQWDEITFFQSFRVCSRSFTIGRHWNGNVPHRIQSETLFVPTRLFAQLGRWGELKSGRAFGTTIRCGSIHHYKNQDRSRQQAGYSLGDRKPHQVPGETEVFTGEHPSAITKWFAEEMRAEEALLNNEPRATRGNPHRD